jgi:outer membrane protein OmpA-like peptidoglycan-associated protein
MKHLIGISGTLTLLSALGCGAAAVPPELASARTAYGRAASGPAASVAPTDLHQAKRSLDAAERSFEEDGDSQVTRDLGYAAERQVEIAESRARAIQTAAGTEQIEEQRLVATEAQRRQTAEQLAQANQQISAQNQAMQAQQAALQGEVQRRQEAEKRASDAAATLAKLASVKQEPRGMVITLSGSVLFASGKSELLPSAQAKLDQIGTALTEQDPESTMVVEGHTDSQGAEQFNQQLSQRRAESVRSYLISRGIASDRITAEGHGLSQPVADNGTPEGRANNRRVEIVVKPPSAPATP